MPLVVFSKGNRFWGVITRTRIAFESFGCMGMFSHPLCSVSCKHDFRVCPVLRALSNVLLSRFLVSEGCVFSRHVFLVGEGSVFPSHFLVSEDSVFPSRFLVFFCCHVFLVS